MFVSTVHFRFCAFGRVGYHAPEREPIPPGERAWRAATGYAAAHAPPHACVHETHVTPCTYVQTLRRALSRMDTGRWRLSPPCVRPLLPSCRAKPCPTVTCGYTLRQSPVNGWVCAPVCACHLAVPQAVLAASRRKRLVCNARYIQGIHRPISPHGLPWSLLATLRAGQPSHSMSGTERSWICLCPAPWRCRLRSPFVRPVRPPVGGRTLSLPLYRACLRTSTVEVSALRPGNISRLR